MCTPTQGVWQPAGCVSCEPVCVCVSARACRHHLSSVHPYRVGVQSEPGCSSPFYLPTYLCVCQSAPVRALVVPACCERGLYFKDSFGTCVEPVSVRESSFLLNSFSCNVNERNNSTRTTSHFDKSPFSLIHCDRSESVEIPPHIPTRTRDERVADCSTAEEVALAALKASRPPSSSNTDIRTALLSPLCSGEDLSRKDLPPREDLRTSPV